MNGKISGNVVKVKRGTFTNNSTGELISYCKFYILCLGNTTENETGYDYEPFSCKIEHYNKLIDLLKSNKPIDVEIEFLRNSDGSYRRVAKKLGDYLL